jgi:hypothetical protein
MKTAYTTALVLVFGSFIASASAASADQAKDVKRIENLTRVALEDYDLGDYEAAKKRLEGALTEIKTAKLDTHPVAASANLYLGAVYAIGLKDSTKGVALIKTALSIDPKVVVPPVLKKPEVDKLIEQAKVAEVKPAAPAAPEGPVVGIYHVPVDSAQEGNDIPIEAKVGLDLKAKDVTLYFRAGGATKWLTAPMKKAKGESYTVTIPAAATAVDQLNYYIDVKNQKNKLVASKGNASTPFVISVVRIRPPDAPPVDEPEDDENPLKKFK